MAHQAISAGGKFKVRDLTTGLISNKRFLQLELKNFKRIDEARPGNYSVPISPTFQSVGSFVLPDKLFQMTVSVTHGIKEAGFDALNLPDKLKMKFYFVTPIEFPDKFKEAKLSATYLEWSDSAEGVGNQLTTGNVEEGNRGFGLVIELLPVFFSFTPS